MTNRRDASRRNTMAGAPAGEPIAVGEQLMQLDQAITLTLQEIDENFSQAHQVITSRILPAIREYEASCAKTWVGARFWKQFFEASAQVSLSQQPLDEVEEYVEEPQDESVHDTHVEADDDDSAQDSHPMQTPPRLSYSIYAPNEDSSPVPAHELESPFQRLKRDVERSRIEDETQRMHASDLSVSMANDPSVALSEVPTSSSPLKWRHPSDPARTRRRSSARPRVSIVGGEQTINPFAPDEKRDWNGIADLRKTPLRNAHTYHVSRAAGDDESLPEGMSPPAAASYSVPKQKYRQTPAKEAARLVVDDVLRSVHDEVPSQPTPARSGRRKSVVGTPLTKRTPGRSRRDSLPTPPTITKSVRPGAEGELPGMLDKMLDLEVCFQADAGERVGVRLKRVRRGHGECADAKHLCAAIRQQPFD